MHIDLLGAFALRTEAGPQPLAGRQQAALVALLALSAGQVVAADRIVAELWPGEPPANPANAVQTRISRLRTVLGAGAIVARAGGYALTVARDDIDVFRFRRLAQDGRAALGVGDAAGAAEVLRSALAVWRGPALADLEFAPFARAEATVLEEERVAVLEARIDADLRLGRHRDVVAELGEVTALYPGSETFWCHLMLALYRCDRQTDALAAFRRARKILVDDHGLEPGSRMRELEAAILAQDASLRLVAVVAETPGNLKRTPTSFIGRRRELTQVAALLRGSRLLTLTGPGGTGKTRLAQAAGQEVLESGDAPDGVWMVELAAVSDPDAVPAAMLRALRVPTGLDTDATRIGQETRGTGPRRRLLDYLAGKRLLLIVDNCEHLVDGVAELADEIMAASSGCVLLATSREPLGVAGERLFGVEPLSLPRVGVVADETSDAVRLFAERARAFRPDFAVGPENGAAVGEICRRLDGIPLALELAAGRVRMLSPVEIARHLDHRFALLTGGSRTALPRQRTLQATVEWSYRLLDETERDTFEKLSVFPGGFCLDAAGAPLDVIGNLVDKSLLVTDTAVLPGRRGSVTRYRMLETLRDFAADRLADRGADDVASVRDRHLAHYRELARAAESAVHGPTQQETVALLELEHANLRTALDHALASGAVESALRLGTSLSWFWWMSGHAHDGLAGLEAAIAAAGDDAPSRDRAMARMWACHLAQADHLLERSIRHGEASLADFAAAADTARAERASTHATADLSSHDAIDPSNDDAVAADRTSRYAAAAPSITDTTTAWPALAGSFLAHVLFRCGRHEDASRINTDALAAAEAAADDWSLASCHIVAGLGALWRGALAAADQSFRVSLRHYEACGDQWGQQRAVFRLATLAEAQGRLEEADALAVTGLELARSLHLAAAESNRLSQLGRLALLRGDTARAADLAARAQHKAEWLGTGDALASARATQGLLLLVLGDVAGAQAMHQQAVDWYRKAAQHLEATESLTVLSLAAHRISAPAPAASASASTHAVDALTEAVTSADPRAIALALEGVACAYAESHPADAAEAFGAATAIRTTVGLAAPQWILPDVAAAHSRVESALGRAGADQRRDHGRQLTGEQILRSLSALRS